MEWDNYAVLPINNYEYWFRKQIAKQSRMKIKKAKRTGVELKLVDFNDELVQRIVNIFNETPYRQGRTFGHYGKNCKTRNITIFR